MTDHSLDACLELLADHRRRRLLEELRRDAANETTIDDLVDRLHGDERISGDGGRAGRERLVIQLRHTHLPKLADQGVVEYDAERETVRYRSDELVESVLDSLPGGVAKPIA